MTAASTTNSPTPAPSQALVTCFDFSVSTYCASKTRATAGSSLACASTAAGTFGLRKCTTRTATTGIKEPEDRPSERVHALSLRCARCLCAFDVQQCPSEPFRRPRAGFLPDFEDVGGRAWWCRSASSRDAHAQERVDLREELDEEQRPDDGNDDD